MSARKTASESKSIRCPKCGYEEIIVTGRLTQEEIEEMYFDREEC